MPSLDWVVMTRSCARLLIVASPEESIECTLAALEVWHRMCDTGTPMALAHCIAQDGLAMLKQASYCMVFGEEQY
jgi:hypothetical protein